MSLPAWGAWIKVVSWVRYVAMLASLPARGAWIKVQINGIQIPVIAASLPAWGAWIKVD